VCGVEQARHRGVGHEADQWHATGEAGVVTRKRPCLCHEPAGHNHDYGDGKPEVLRQNLAVAQVPADVATGMQALRDRDQAGGRRRADSRCDTAVPEVRQSRRRGWRTNFRSTMQVGGSEREGAGPQEYGTSFPIS